MVRGEHEKVAELNGCHRSQGQGNFFCPVYDIQSGA